MMTILVTCCTVPSMLLQCDTKRGCELKAKLEGWNVLRQVRRTAKTDNSYAPHNDVSVNDGPHTRRWSHNTIIFTIVLQLPTVFSIVTCCTGL